MSGEFNRTIHSVKLATDPKGTKQSARFLISRIKTNFNSEAQGPKTKEMNKICLLKIKYIYTFSFVFVS